MNGQKDASEGAELSCAAIARLRDRDRFFCAMFLPPEIREAAFVLIALNVELSKALVLPVSGSVTGPMAGLIRLQWWRDVVQEPAQGRASRMPVAMELAELLEGGRIAPESVLRLIDAREAELCGLPDWVAWRTAMLDGAGMMQRMVGELLGVVDAAQLAMIVHAGAAFGTGTLLRHLLDVLAAGRMPLPQEALEQAGLPRDADGTAFLEGERLAPVVTCLRQEGRAFLPSRAECRKARLATLPAVLADRDLRRGPVPSGMSRGLGDRLAVMRRAFFR
ncbi:phytoene synthase [Acetobacter estunensis NRIC 0472]|uniref:Phytoene synthase n=1 Tax=Acetobacter estunensis TaxID=104097 RepID=A0A967B464_9PROT|nr:squalene/phytoene synthase family protein [Acetobacter estunensis]NHO52530.1 hypothetical protein [Acetobacter estunensis]GBQ26239.1 phytoene synthase [Acetobacter estunensis NRIC 0472]